VPAVGSRARGADGHDSRNHPRMPAPASLGWTGSSAARRRAARAIMDGHATATATSEMAETRPHTGPPPGTANKARRPHGTGASSFTVPVRSGPFGPRRRRPGSRRRRKLNALSQLRSRAVRQQIHESS
jgi:hypothetical protein